METKGSCCEVDCCGGEDASLRSDRLRQAVKELYAALVSRECCCCGPDCGCACCRTEARTEKAA